MVIVTAPNREPGLRLRHSAIWRCWQARLPQHLAQNGARTRLTAPSRGSDSVSASGFLQPGRSRRAPLGVLTVLRQQTRAAVLPCRAATPPRALRTWADGRWERWVGRVPYVLVVERVPGGTMVFRTTGTYDDLPGGRRLRGTTWGVTYAD